MVKTETRLLIVKEMRLVVRIVVPSAYKESTDRPARGQVSKDQVKESVRNIERRPSTALAMRKEGMKNVEEDADMEKTTNVDDIVRVVS